MDKGTVESAFAAAGLARVAQDANRLTQPSIRIKTRVIGDESEIPLGASKFGGLPDLAPGMQWPEFKGMPMSFIAQIRLSDLRSLEAAKVLPATGLLWFFYDAQQQTFGSDPADKAGWTVIYRDGAPVPAQLHRTEASQALPKGARFKPCSVSFASELTLPERPALEAPGLMWTPDEQKRYEDLYANYPNEADRGATRHRMLGHPDTIQDDMRAQCQLQAHGVSSADDPRAAQLLPAAMDWLLLLQVDTDEDAGMRWANTGMLYYWIRRDALQARRFGDVWLVLQSE
jgi:uncharacterized protein YwqG